MNFDDFLKACKNGDLTRVQEGVAHVDLRQTDPVGVTPLMGAAWEGYAEVVKLLIPGSDLRQSDRWGNTALMRAVDQGYVEVVRDLLPGSDLRQADGEGATALMLAAYRGHVKVVRSLISGSDLRQKDKHGLNAYANAVEAREWACVEELALHDSEWENLQWPKAARPEDLPQWAARIERQAIAGEIAPVKTSVAHPAKQRHRL